MSCNATDPINSDISIYGGITDTTDIAPSAVFIGVYALLAPIAIWRLVSPASRTMILFRPNLFIAVRLATFIIRIVQAKCHYASGLFIAELILELAGFNIICEPFVALLEQNLHASAYNNGIQENPLFALLLRLLRVGLLVSLILGIYTGTQYSGADTTQAATRLDHYRLATSGLNLGVVSLTLILVVVLHRPFRCEIKSTLFLALVGCLLIIPSTYRLAAVTQMYSNTGNETKILFYVLGATFEFLATLAIVAVNLRQLFDLDYVHPMGRHGIIGRIMSCFSSDDEHVNHPPKFVAPPQQYTDQPKAATPMQNGAVVNGEKPQNGYAVSDSHQDYHRPVHTHDNEALNLLDPRTGGGGPITRIGYYAYKKATGKDGERAEQAPKDPQMLSMA